MSSINHQIHRTCSPAQTEKPLELKYLLTTTTSTGVFNSTPFLRSKVGDDTSAITRGPFTPACHLLPFQQSAARHFSLHLGLVNYSPSETSKRPPRNPSLQSTAPVCELGRWLPSSGKDNPLAKPLPQLVHACCGFEIPGPRMLGREGA